MVRETEVLSEGEAQALARAWQRGDVKPEDFDPRLRVWKMRETVAQAVRDGQIHRLDFVKEVQRRAGAGAYGLPAQHYFDRDKEFDLIIERTVRKRGQRT